MTNAYPISAVMVCLNESHHLRSSLPRLAFCDEILVVDLGSEDDSVQAARAFGARVITHAWVPYREMIIPYLLDQVNHDWVLMTDPDLLFPPDLGDPLQDLLSQAQTPPLGMVYFPLITCYGKRPILYGQKAGRRAYRAVIHRQRVDLTDLLHHKGVGLREGFTAVCLRPRSAADDIQHHWIDSWEAAMAKARRYLPHEGRTRHALGQHFTWQATIAELLSSLSADLQRKAYLDRHSFQIMAFQLWYGLNANLALRRYERQLRESPDL